MFNLPASRPPPPLTQQPHLSLCDVAFLLSFEWDSSPLLPQDSSLSETTHQRVFFPTVPSFFMCAIAVCVWSFLTWGVVNIKDQNENAFFFFQWCHNVKLFNCAATTCVKRLSCPFTASSNGLEMPMKMQAFSLTPVPALWLTFPTCSSLREQSRV